MWYVQTLKFSSFLVWRLCVVVCSKKNLFKFTRTRTRTNKTAPQNFYPNQLRTRTRTSGSDKYWYLCINVA
eukprot:UN11043